MSAFSSNELVLMNSISALYACFKLTNAARITIHRTARRWSRLKQTSFPAKVKKSIGKSYVTMCETFYKKPPQLDIPSRRSALCLLFKDSCKELIEEVAKNLMDDLQDESLDVIVCIPDLFLMQAMNLMPEEVKFAVQSSAEDIFGRLAALKELGVEFVILNRNQEIDNYVTLGFCPILLLEDSDNEDAYLQNAFLFLRRISEIRDVWNHTVLVYKPTPLKEAEEEGAMVLQAQDVHHRLRDWSRHNISEDSAGRLRILFGGTINERNSLHLAEKEDVDGFFITVSQSVDVLAIKAALRRRSSTS